MQSSGPSHSQTSTSAPAINENFTIPEPQENIEPDVSEPCLRTLLSLRSPFINKLNRMIQVMIMMMPTQLLVARMPFHSSTLHGCDK